MLDLIACGYSLARSSGLLVALSALAAAFAASSDACAQDCPACIKAPEVFLGDTPFVGTQTGCQIPASSGECGLSSYNTNFRSFTPTQTGSYRISTCTVVSGNSLTNLTVWSDCSPSSVVACGIAGCPSGAFSGAIIGVVDLFEGINYRIGIGTLCCADDFIESGILSIDLIDAPGTGCASATTAVVGLNAFDTTDRNEIVDLAGACDPTPRGGTFDDRIYNAQYFRFTPPSSGVYTISTCGQDEEIWERLAVLGGCSVADGVLACSDANCSSSTDYTGSTIVGVALDAGVEYTILVGGVLASQYGRGAFTIAPFVPCPAPKPTVLEFEPCGSDLNSGCLSGTLPAQVIEIGDSVRGTMWAANGVRDTDWYRIEITEGTEITLELNSRIPSFATFVFSDCSSSLFVDQTSGVCPGLTDGECLPPGSYFIVVAPYDFWGFPCGYPAGNSYTLTVTGVPCDASSPPNDRCVDAIAVTEGATPFDNYFADNEVQSDTCALIGRDVWFAFTAAKTGNHRFAVCNGAVPFNSGMDIWNACPADGGSFIACNRDASDPQCVNSSYSTIILPMTAGQRVLVRVGSEWFFEFLPPGEADFIVEFIGENAVCGDPDVGECCAEKGTPFCSDIGCCNFVCAFDAVCCGVAWDRVCAASAALYCYDTCGLPPQNDQCSNGTVVTAGANAFRNRQAEGSTQTPCGTIYSDVWFQYTAKTDRPVTISFCEADGGWALVTGGDNGELDTRLAVFDGCAGTLVACSDNACGVAAKVSFTPSCGAIYLIAIGSRDDQGGVYSQGIGSFTLIESASCGGGCAADLNGDGAVGAQDLAALLGGWDGAAGDLNGDGTTNAQDLAALLAAWGPCVS